MLYFTKLIKSTFAVHLIALITALLLTGSMYFSTSLEKCKPCISGDNAQVDPLEYHFLATNYYYTNRFPVFGFLVDEQFYKICPDRDHRISSTKVYLDMFRQLGPITICTRPPIYPLTISLLYQIFGYNLIIPIYFNFACILIILYLMIWGSFLLFGQIGLVTGIIGATLFTNLFPLNPLTFYPDILQMLFVLAFYLTIWYSIQKNRSNWAWVSGCLWGMSLLTKGYFLSALITIPLFLVFYKKMGSITWRYLLRCLASCFFVILPWTIFVNYINYTTKAQRKDWKTQLNRIYPISVFDKKEDIVESTDSGLKAYKSTLTYFYNSYLKSPNFVLLTSQIDPEAFLMVHNEYCTDGKNHYEFSILKNSFYNQLDKNIHPFKQIAIFYWQYPSYIYIIAYRKFMSGFLDEWYFPATQSGIFFMCLYYCIKARQWWTKILALFSIVIAVYSNYYQPIKPVLVLLLLTIPLILPWINSQALDAKNYLFFALYSSMLLLTVIMYGNYIYNCVLEPISWMLFLGYTVKILRQVIVFIFH